jgi:hypothetical protein
MQQTESQTNAPAPEFRSVESLYNEMNLLKHSLKLVPLSNRMNNDTNSLEIYPYNNENNAFSYGLQFEFDTDIECEILVHIVAFERRHANSNAIKIKPSKYSLIFNIPIKRFNAGIGQVYMLPKENCIDFSMISDEDLRYDESMDPFKYPIIIEMRATDNKSSSSELNHSLNRSHTKYQLTYATIIRGNDNSFSIKVLKQKVQIDQHIYELAEFYGFDGSSESNDIPVNENEHVVDIESHLCDASLCVICMTDMADVALLPCRHMCLCFECSKTLRTQTNKCPICRAKILNLIRIYQDPDTMENTAEENNHLHE